MAWERASFARPPCAEFVTMRLLNELTSITLSDKFAAPPVLVSHPALHTHNRVRRCRRHQQRAAAVDPSTTTATPPPHTPLRATSISPNRHSSVDQGRLGLPWWPILLYTSIFFPAATARRFSGCAALGHHRHWRRLATPQRRAAVLSPCPSPLTSLTPSPYNRNNA